MRHGFSIANFEDDKNDDFFQEDISKIRQFCFKKKKKKNFINSGTYGDIFLISDNYVAKVCEEIESISTIPEIAILSSFSHSSILKARYIFSFSDEVMFLLPRYDCNLNEYSTQDNEIKMSITKQLASGVQYLHSNRILHLDLTCSNILCKCSSNSVKVVISDFSLSRLILDDYIDCSLPKVTIEYKPYENLLGSKRFSKKTDMWSLGVCLFKLWEGRNLINLVYVPENKTSSEIYELSAVFEIEKINSEGCWPPTQIQIIRGLLHLDVEKRTSETLLCDNLDIEKFVRNEENEEFEISEQQKNIINRHFTTFDIKLFPYVFKLYNKFLRTSKLQNDENAIFLNCCAIIKSLCNESFEVTERIDERILNSVFSIVSANRGKIL